MRAALKAAVAWVASCFREPPLTDEEKARCRFVAKFGARQPGDAELLRRYLRDINRQIGDSSKE